MNLKLNDEQIRVVLTPATKWSALEKILTIMDKQIPNSSAIKFCQTLMREIDSAADIENDEKD